MKPRVLVADDDIMNREIARRMLVRLGAEVEEVPDGPSAVEAFLRASASPRPFALVFLDLAMPGLDGLAVAGRLREGGYEGLIYALTGRDEGSGLAAAGFDGFLPKPVSIEAFATIMGKVGFATGSAFPEGLWAEAGALFRFCPSCGGSRLVAERGRRWICPDCGFEYFHNVATAAGIVVATESGVLLIVRAKEPEKGKLCLPGGFVEPGERAEDAALRECREELGWAPERIEFLASYPNLYRYKSVPYATCDLYFRSLSAPPALADLDPDRGETAGIRYGLREDFPWDEIAFEPARRALRRYFRTTSG